MGKLKIVISIALALSTLGAALPTTSDENLKPEARDASESQEDEFVPSSYILPNQIFNDGKPFYVGKDPVSGQLDFNSKKAGFETSANEVFDPKEKIVLSSGSSPNFHDFLNLPVKYSSSKFVYPLVSSSYANLKYQGNNKNYNSKKGQTVMPTSMTSTSSPHYYNLQRNITKLHLASNSAVYPTTSRTTTTTASTTTPPPRTYTTRKPISSTTPFTVATTTTTRKKFVPTKKYNQPTSAIPTSSSEEVKKSTKPQTKPPQKSTTPILTTTTKRISTTAVPKTTKTTPSSTTPTRRTTPQSSIFPTNPTTTTTVNNPVVFSDSPPSFSPIPSSGTKKPLLEVSDVYNSVGQKNEPNLSLADLFNSLADEEEENSLSQNQGLDAQGNLMRPISPSKPSPFAVNQATTVGPSSTRQPSSGNQSPQQPASVQATLSIHPSKQTQQNKLNSEQQEQAQGGSSFNGEYVQYQVQQPNVMQYHPTSNINNVVISPGQQSATFVLGSQQTVGSNSFMGSVEKEPLFSKEPPVQYGTVINEDINSAFPQKDNANKNTINFQQIGNQEQTQELLVSSNIRFPANEGQISDSSADGSSVNGHAQPLTMHLQMQQAGNQVVFPNPEVGTTSSITPNTQANEIQYNTENQGDVLIQQHEVLNLNAHRHNQPQTQNQGPPDHHVQQHGPQERPQQMPFQAYPPQGGEGHRPAQHMEPPHFHSRPPPEYHEQPNRSPVPNRQPFPMGPHAPNGPNHGPPPPGSQPPPSYMYNEFTRKPIPGMNRPNPDRTLPNILPQFRPNAKLSQGHPTNFNQEPGNIRIQHPQFQKRPGSPQFSHRRQPVAGRYPVTRVPEYPGGPPPPPPSQEANRRIYRVSPYPPQFVDRNYLRRPQQLPQLQRPLDYGYERHAVYKTIPDPYQPRPEPPSGPATERLAAFEEEDLVINDPPQPVMKKDETDDIKLEPVVTLQMLKSQQKSSEDSGEIKVPGDSQNSFEKTGPNQGLYVVYPVKPSLNGPEHDINESAETKEPAPVIAPLESGSITASANDYQNTPFSVVRDQPQEPILVVKNKVHTLQQKQSKDKFPYPLEKPDLSYSGFGPKHHNEIDRLDRDPGVIIAPRIVNGAYPHNVITETPIAIAYTPTEPNHHYHDVRGPYMQDRFSSVNLATPVIREIRDQQTEDTLNQDLDTRGQNFEKDFMAPFYPSMSLDTATSSPIASNGWNIFHGTTERHGASSLYEKNNINRADVSSAGSSDEEESTTKSFELDSFQPELQGGFKPIYPPGYKLDDEEPEQNVKPANERPLALALTRVEPRTASTTTSTTAMPTSSAVITTTTTTTTTPRPKTVPTTKKTTTKPSPTPQALTGTSTVAPEVTPATTTSPTQTSPKPTTQRKKTPFETSLEALLFGDDEDFEDEPVASPDEAKSSSS
ncbi:uncharacterized protein LOC129942082 [Eupeodes corollae]|uniref:uncharacterized protein LOC129942082 n=1 Tax=Eupeodes corollae TaxID=290404 RepID=UPI0024925A52|nr:uncharacterized protein LOC129942082 [Eupeodes corollae]